MIAMYYERCKNAIQCRRRREIGFGSTTKTGPGLGVRAHQDSSTYHTGAKVSDADLKTLALDKGSELGKWNYTIRPRINA
jgi:hypothetical protein